MVWVSTGMGAQPAGLSLPAIHTALQMADVSQDDWLELTAQLKFVAAVVVEQGRKKQG